MTYGCLRTRDNGGDLLEGPRVAAEHCAQFCAHHRTLLSATGVRVTPVTAIKRVTCSI
jgi:hypothetical protein